MSLLFTACGHEHTYSADWSYDETHHWHASTCEHTDEKSDYGEHVYADDYGTDCDTCGKTRIAPIDLWYGTTVDLQEAVAGVITITTAEQLAGLSKAFNEGTTFAGVTIKLDANIDLNNKEWTPIGYGSSHANGTKISGKRFSGVFDGQGHTISNLKVTTFVGGEENATASTGIGLFGAAFNATIKDFTISNAVVTGNHHVAVAVGHARGITIEKVNVENATVSCVYLDEKESGDKAGVVVAFIGISHENSALIKECSAKNSTVNASRDAGQIIGTFAIYDGDASMAGCANRATESGNTATNVVVSWDEAGTGANIKNVIYGRVVGSNN